MRNKLKKLRDYLTLGSFQLLLVVMVIIKYLKLKTFKTLPNEKKIMTIELIFIMEKCCNFQLACK